MLCKKLGILDNFIFIINADLSAKPCGSIDTDYDDKVFSLKVL